MSPVPCLASSTIKLLDTRGFRIDKDGHDQIIFKVTEPGEIVVKARVLKPIPTASIRLLLEGPSDLRVEKQGAAPLRLRYAPEEPHSDALWRITVINISKLGPMTGKISIGLEPGQLPDRSDSANLNRTDGQVTYVGESRLRAVCRDKNRDIYLRLDMERGTGSFYMSFNPVFRLTAEYASEHLIEVRGNGTHPLLLDTRKRTLYFADGERGVFCRVSLYYGQNG